MNKRLAIPSFVLSMALASLACTIFVGGPDSPAQPIPVSVEAAETIQDQFKQAVESGLTTGVVSLQLNESQLTSYLAFKLAQQSQPWMTEPQVYLRDGQIQLFGKVQRGLFLANVAMIIDVGVDETGQPKIEVASADFGPLPAPQGLNAAVSALVAEAYTGTLGPIATGFRLETISIADGLMTLSGRIE